MKIMAKLTDTQLIVLSKAAAREDGLAIVPPKMNKAAAAKVGSSLVVRKLMRELKAKPGMPVWRADEDGRGISLMITRAGRDAIGVEDDAEESKETVAPTKKQTKASSRGKNIGPEGCACALYVCAARRLEAGAGDQHAFGEGWSHDRCACRCDRLVAAYDARRAYRTAQARVRDRAVARRWRGVGLPRSSDRQPPDHGDPHNEQPADRAVG
ncbi:MAG: hypothetical protein V9G24_02325 [Rhodoblastus sp.]